MYAGAEGLMVTDGEGGEVGKVKVSEKWLEVGPDDGWTGKLRSEDEKGSRDSYFTCHA